MAAPNFVGGAAPVAQVQTNTFAVTWIVGETVTFQIGQSIYTYTITSTVIATFLPLLAAALNALNATVYPEFGPKEIVWTNTATTLVATAGTPGKPFTITISTNSASGTITPAATTASAGPFHWDTPANWSTGAIPVSTDTPTLYREGAWIKYGFAQSAVTLASLRCVATNFRIGLPQTNTDGTPYPEYRSLYLNIGVTSGYLWVSSGTFQINTGSVQTAWQVDGTASQGDDTTAGTPAAIFRGTHVSNAWNFFGGNVGLGFFAEASTALTLVAGPGATVTCGTGCTLDTVTNNGAALELNTAVVTLLAHPTASAKAVTTILGSGAVAQLTCQGGSVAYQSSGTLNGNTILGGSASLSYDGDARAKTITNPVLLQSASATFSDKYGCTYAAGLVLHYVDCQPGSVGIRANVSLTIASL